MGLKKLKLGVKLLGLSYATVIGCSRFEHYHSFANESIPMLEEKVLEK